MSRGNRRRRLSGQSLNVFDAKRGLWHQTWIDSNAGLLVLEGTFNAGSLSMSDATLPGKKRSQAREPDHVDAGHADGSVRQLWRTSTDGGTTWKTAFDGKYVRLEAPAAEVASPSFAIPRRVR